MTPTDTDFSKNDDPASGQVIEKCRWNQRLLFLLYFANLSIGLFGTTIKEIGQTKIRPNGRQVFLSSSHYRNQFSFVLLHTVKVRLFEMKINGK